MRTQNAAYILISIFGISVSLGLMVDHGIGKTPNAPIRQKRLPAEEVEIKSPPKPLTRPRAAVIAVIDTGVDFNHPDLRNMRWENPGESGLDSQDRDKRTNGIDDEGNGFIDDVSGVDFTNGSREILDEHGHGTHIAGIIAAHRGESQIQIMSLKYYKNGVSGAEALKNSIAAMRYAVEKRVDIINYSGGGNSPSVEELRILQEASRLGILIVAAAGNEGANSEKQPFYPANYDLPNILSVTASSGERSGVLPTSNYGVRSVAVAAPGKDIMSTLPGGRYGKMTGTSQATAIVTAAAARIRGGSEKVSPEAVIERMIAASNPVKALSGKTRGASKIDFEETERIMRSKSKGESTKQERLALIQALDREVQAGLTPLQ